MKARLLFWCVSLLLVIKFCCSENGYCDKFNEPDKYKQSNNKITFIAHPSRPDNVSVPIIEEIIDGSVLREQDYWRSVIINLTSEVSWDGLHYIDENVMKARQVPTSVLFFSVGDTAEIILKKLPGKVILCEVERGRYDESKHFYKEKQLLYWTPTGDCSFKFLNFSDEFFCRWYIKTYYEYNINGIPVRLRFEEAFDLIEETKSNDRRAPSYRDDNLQTNDYKREIDGSAITIYGRLGVDRGIVIKPQVPHRIYSSRPSVRKCEAIHHEWPENKTYLLTSQLNQDNSLNLFGSTLTLPVYTGRFYSCEFELPVLETRYLGRWSIITYFNDTNIYKDGLTKQIDTLNILEIKVSHGSRISY